MAIKLKLINGNKTLELGNNLYKIVNIDGIDYPELELDVKNNANYDGGTLNNKRVDKRYINIVADYKGNDKEKERKELISFFNPKNNLSLIVNYNYNIKIIDFEIEKFNAKLTNIYDELSFSCDLVCVDPFFKDITMHKVDMGKLEGVSFHFPLTIPEMEGVVFGFREPEEIKNIVNLGDVETGIIIALNAKGPLLNPKIYNHGTGEFIQLNLPMIDGETIIITTDKGNKRIFKCTPEGDMNLFSFLDLNSTFLQLRPGDNILQYTAGEGANNLDVSIYYNNNYLGV